MNEPGLELVETLVIISATLQIGVIALCLLFYKRLSDEEKRIWKWFLYPLVAILFRRMLATSRYSYHFPTLEVEYVATIFATICWIVLIYKMMLKKLNGK